MDPFALNLIMIIGFVLGSGLIIVEAFIPGFGVAGICGVILEIAALRCCWLLHGTVCLSEQPSSFPTAAR